MSGTAANNFNPTNNDQHYVQVDNLGAQYPNTVDALPNVQYPDMPGGPASNSPISPDQRAHPAAVVLPPTPQSLGLPVYGATLGIHNYQATPQE